MKRNAIKNAKRVLFLSAMIIVLAACSDSDEAGTTEEDASSEEKDSIHLRMTEDPDFLDPHMMEASLTEQMLLNVFEGLLSPEEDGSLAPAIAEDYEESDDGLTYTFDLREDVTFHNGAPVTAEDVEYSIERLTGEKSEDAKSENFDIVEDVEAEDEHTVVITLEKPNSAFLSYLTGKDAAIIPESNDGKHNDDPIGTGPFQLEEYNPGAEIVLEKNEEYWKEDLPYLSKATFDIQEDDEAAFASMQAGEIDVMQIPGHRIPEIEDEFELEYQDNNSTVLIGMNEDREPFDDKKVRQAVNYAVNKDDVIDAAYSDYATRIGSNMSPAMGDAYKEGLEHVYDQDLEKAKELLEEAGYPDGFETSITISSHTDNYSDIAQVAAENLAEIGVDVDIDVMEWGVWLDDVYEGRDYDMTAIDFTGKLSPYDILSRYISDEENNFMNFENEEYDAVLEDALAEDDEEKQNELYQDAQQILSDEAAAVYIGDYQFVWAMDPSLKGFKKYPIFFLDLSEIEFE
ncbi:MAG TPA: ABC transporter substrate-binding protein [Pseudogracilibacillus sp.]|nr:ABC transporter substrate-binding protein [Pseudogracilibacillus sp.]